MKATTGSPRPRFSVAAMSQIGSLLLAGLIAGPAAAVVRSTGAGGPWDDPATWIGGNPPTAADDVILSGPVWIAMSAACASLVVETTGQLTNWTGSPSTLSVGGNIQNQGSLLSSSLQLTMRVGGDLDNEGTWAVAQTVVTGNADRHLATSELSSFSSKLSYDPAASGDLIVDTPFVALADIALGTGRMILQPDCPLTLEHAAFRDG
ncbi:MAG: hypothetical protein KC729_12580, partial [Candidatus Eisenbacteria bacterium]|nr:hypothetical protein [Candidatus Eisenbacteria bacterium]